MPSEIFHRKGPVTFRAPYFDEFVIGASPEGRLPRDPNAHALFYYNLLAAKNLDDAKKCLVDERELSPVFGVPQARKLLESVAFLYDTTPGAMVRYWDVVDKQRMAMGANSNADLPHAMRFRFN